VAPKVFTTASVGFVAYCKHSKQRTA